MWICGLVCIGVDERLMSIEYQLQWKRMELLLIIFRTHPPDHYKTLFACVCGLKTPLNLEVRYFVVENALPTLTKYALKATFNWFSLI